jgi:hypothetical protein
MRGMIGTAMLAIWMGISIGASQAAGAPRNPSSPPPAAPSGMQMAIDSAPLTAANGEIYVNQECAIFPGFQTTGLTGVKKPKGKKDPVICHLEGVARSQHREEAVLGNELGRRDVAVQEQEYVLQNITMKPVVFVVMEEVPKGWVVDSDPKPTKLQGTMAVFQVDADPGKTVRLHVGVRRTTDLKPKPLPPASAP